MNERSCIVQSNERYPLVWASVIHNLTTMHNAFKALLTGLVTLVLETIAQAPVMEALCSGTFTGDGFDAIPGIIFLKLFLFLPFYWLSRSILGVGALAHAGTYLLVTTVIAPLFAWNIFFCTWQNAVAGTLLAGTMQVLYNRLPARWQFQ
jgi:hypothetical protein